MPFHLYYKDKEILLTVNVDQTDNTSYAVDNFSLG